MFQKTHARFFLPVSITVALWWLLFLRVPFRVAPYSFRLRHLTRIFLTAPFRSACLTCWNGDLTNRFGRRSHHSNASSTDGLQYLACARCALVAVGVVVFGALSSLPQSRIHRIAVSVERPRVNLEEGAFNETCRAYVVCRIGDGLDSTRSFGQAPRSITSGSRLLHSR